MLQEIPTLGSSQVRPVFVSTEILNRSSARDNFETRTNGQRPEDRFMGAAARYSSSEKKYCRLTFPTEWKVEKDSPTDTHRHLSHLIGLYPGYAITSFDPSAQGTGPAKGYSKNQILDAAAVSLYHRGNGTGLDADSGWEKAWRAAAWAQLGNSSMFYHELSVCCRSFLDTITSCTTPHLTDYTLCLIIL